MYLPGAWADGQRTVSIERTYERRVVSALTVPEESEECSGWSASSLAVMRTESRLSLAIRGSGAMTITIWLVASVLCPKGT